MFLNFNNIKIKIKNTNILNLNKKNFSFIYIPIKKRFSIQTKSNKINNFSTSDIIPQEISTENFITMLKLPKKSNYRMRAHANPLAGISIP